MSAENPGRTGRPPLTERRKAQTRLEIAHEAVRLFTAKGVAATSAEEIAAAAGISLRTLWRYFPSKESCVLPLLTSGIEVTARCMRAWPPGEAMTWLLKEMERCSQDLVTHLPTLFDLVRLTQSEPGLRAVWLQAHQDAEPVFAAVLAHRAALPPDDLSARMQAAMINTALRVAMEHHASKPGPPTEEAVLRTVRTAFLTVAQGLPD
ncbi:AcrR family transcriptional regulator [Kibdelosporangium banguiense]|uniref:AcrR family transcriptional regulator n=1 Tax=Kibdelosporangium banguiense TaxID=1365924 RepID=A0ABS4U104_9PSEU|nr:TetR/AcrR family transcriptional regulator [Kibdelosporangium banguiense]MBP2330332.1 AcrR family transcriptional regulator [Kibdelosporangium banguiense]